MAEPDLRGSPFEQQPIGEVWAEYKRTGAEDIRNYLVEKYLHLVRFSAERLSAGLPNEVDVEDLMSAGLFGLFNAIQRFDLERQIKFETYCAMRIRGAMLDELRHMDPTPRIRRQREALMANARRQLAQELGRPPTNEEIRLHLNLDTATFELILRDSAAVATISINRKVAQADGSQESREIDLSGDDEAQSPLRHLEYKDVQELVTRGLSRAERLIVLLYYFEGLTMKEIGVTLDLCESRVSQMHSSIVQRLRAQMRHRAGELEPVR